MIETHPYGDFVPRGATSMIVGSFPIGKFSDPRRRHEIRPHEMDFYFGGEKNLLWKLLGECYGRELRTKEDVIALLKEKKIAIGDVIHSCKRVGGRASDSDLYEITWNHGLIDLIKKKKIKKLYFTSKQVHRWFKKLFPGEHEFEEVLLISPSAQSARAVVRSPAFLEWKKKNPQGRPKDFIQDSYRKVFT